MSVIIRLQGLPWSANAMDIRTYFHGLSIPEGGVHIVGGDLGDAFIAFANDEDARVAMQMDSGRIKECRVKLLLSSRTEMQKVIEAARTRNMVMQGLVPASPVVAPSALPVIQQPHPAMGVMAPTMMMAGAGSMHPHHPHQAMMGDHQHPMMSTMHAMTPQQQQQQMMYVNRMMQPQYVQQSPMDPYMAVAAPQHLGGSDYGVTPMGMGGAVAVGGAMKAAATLPSAYAGIGGIPMGGAAVVAAARQRDGPVMQQQQQQQSPIASGMGNSKSSSGNEAPKRSSVERGGRRDRDSEPDRERFRDRDRDGRPGGGRRRDRSRSPRGRRSRSRDRDAFGRNRDNRMDRGGPDYTRGGTEDRRAGMDGGNRRGVSQGRSGDGSSNRQEADGAQFRSPGGDRGFNNRNNFGGSQPAYSQDMDSPRRGPGLRDARMPQQGGRDGPADGSRPAFQNGGRAAEGEVVVLEDSSPVKKDNNQPPSSVSGENRERGQRRDASSGKSNRVSRWGGDTDSAQASSEREDATPASSGDKARPSNKAGNDQPWQGDGSGGGTRGNQPPGGGRGDTEPMRKGADGNVAEPDFRRQGGGGRGVGTCAIIRGVPFSASLPSIREFFGGLIIPPDGLRLPLDERGRRLPVALVRFADAYQCRMGVERDKQLLHGSVVDVVPCPEEEFTSVSSFVSQMGNHSSLGQQQQQQMPNQQQIPDQQQQNNRRHQQMSPPSSAMNNENEGRGGRRQLLPNAGMGLDPSEERCVFLKGLPFSCREADVVNFFEGYSILNVYVEYDSEVNRARGTGYVEFAGAAEARRSLCLDGKMIGRRYIQLMQVAKSEMATAMSQSFNGMNNNNNGEGDIRNGPRVGNFAGSDARNGPRGGMMKDDRNFGEENCAGPNDRAFIPPADCCLVTGLPFDAIDRDILEFFGPADVVPTAIHLMLNQQGRPSGDAYCEFSSVVECKRALQRDGTAVRPGSRLTLNVAPVSRRELERTLGEASRGNAGMGHPPHFGGRGVDDMMQHGRGSPAMHRDFRQGNFPPRMPNHLNSDGPLERGPPLIDRPPLRPAGLEQFGRPGCVVELSNISFSATVDDILNFLQGFHLNHKQVIRRFREDGLPTGDARISFPCPEDASAAIHQFNRKVMFGRTITMHLI